MGEVPRQPLRGELFDHPAARGLVQRAEKVGLRETRCAPDGIELELRPGRCRELEEIDGSGRQAGKPLPDDFADTLGAGELREGPRQPDRAARHLDRPGLHQGAPEFADEECVALCEVADRIGELAQLRAEVASHGAPDELGHLLAGETGQAHTDHVVGPSQVCERLRESLRDVGLGVAEGCEQQNASVARGPCQVTQEEEGRGVGPVPVLQDQQRRPAHGDRRKKVGHGGVQPVALGIRIGLDRGLEIDDAPRQIWEEAGELTTAGAERVFEHGRFGEPRQVIECLDERPVRGAHDSVAGAVEDEGAAPCGFAGELPHEAALSRAGLAAQKHDSAAFALRPWHEGAQRCQLGRTPDEGECRGEAERTGKVVDAAAHR